jgi:hypothetical protein
VVPIYLRKTLYLVTGHASYICEIAGHSSELVIFSLALILEYDLDSELFTYLLTILLVKSSPMVSGKICAGLLALSSGQLALFSIRRGAAGQLFVGSFENLTFFQSFHL